MLHAGVKAYEFNSLRNLNLYQIGYCVGRMYQYEFLWLLFIRTHRHLTTSSSRSPGQHQWLSSDEKKSQYLPSEWFWGWCGCSHFYLGYDNRRILWFGNSTPRISLTIIVGCIPISQLGQFINPHLLLQKLSMWCRTVLEIEPITQPGSSSTLSLPSIVSSSSSSLSSPSWSSSELARSLGLSPIAFDISSTVVLCFLVVVPVFSAVVISFSFSIIAVCAFWARCLATVVSLST